MSHSPMYRHPHQSVADYLGEGATWRYLARVSKPPYPVLWSTSDPYTFRGAVSGAPEGGYIKYRRAKHQLRFGYDGAVQAPAGMAPAESERGAIEREFNDKTAKLPVPVDLTQTELEQVLTPEMRRARARGAGNLMVRWKILPDDSLLCDCIEMRMHDCDAKYLSFYWIEPPGNRAEGKWVCGRRRI